MSIKAILIGLLAVCLLAACAATMVGCVAGAEGCDNPDTGIVNPAELDYHVKFDPGYAEIIMILVEVFKWMGMSPVPPQLI